MDDWPKKEPGGGQLVLDGDEYELKRTNERINRYIDAAISENTRRAYRADLEDFGRWCSQKGLRALPARPWTVANYLSALAETGEYKASTLERRATAIRQAHKIAGEPNPFEEYGDGSYKLKRFMRGLVRELGRKPDKKTAARVARLRKMVLRLEEDCEARLLRDRALLLVGFLGAMRRSELVALEVEDLEWVEGKGVSLHIRESKTDQEQRGELIGLPKQEVEELCAVRALEAWLNAACITSGPIFRPIDRWGNIRPRGLSDKSVARIVKKAAVFAGFDPADFAGHSLRSGLATSAAAAGKEERDIQAQTRHKSRESLREYIHRGSLFKNNAASGLFTYDGFQRMYAWFNQNFEPPRGVVPRKDEEWQWRDGEPYRATEVLEIKYGGTFAGHVIEEVAEVLEARSKVWAKTRKSENPERRVEQS